MRHVRVLFKSVPHTVPIRAAQTWLDHQDGVTNDPFLICDYQAVGFQAFPSLHIHYLIISKSSFAEGRPIPGYAFLQRPCISRSGFLDDPCEVYRGSKYLNVE